MLPGVPSRNLRLAVADDIPAVLALWATAAEDAHRPPDTATALEALLARDPDALLLATDGDELIGSIIAGWDGWRCHLYRLAVAPAYRRQGIGRQLIAAAEERFRRLGGSRAGAMVLDDNPSARSTWAASGYSQQPEWSRWIKPLP
jgi:ribosomal protein S18 acetylase RimI-like enzyme